MTVLKKLYDHLFVVAVVIAYVIMFILRPGMGIDSLKNSSYYLKEMLLIMPVIFVLTALLDLWVPKEKIIKYLGTEAKTKGVVLAFALGSVSAGPIYAAFPMCVMLHKKGASVRNLVIILSSWAVIKIPMLLNEVKYLGIKFMVIRYILTIIAIIIFSWITAKIVTKEDFPQTEEIPGGLSVNTSACMGCRLCTKNYADLFKMQNKKAFVKSQDVKIDMDRLFTTISACPVNAITYVETPR
ncbi:permease [Acetobacterium bakii]|uniref:Permease n=1 Tax=Acetobacterium bakii TaxID=52689 RepID=A0A0L6U1B2_9FIRM|nr:permease [Acetobacterium bakii]KNZ42306.1 permease [Acetobacterium bakii]